MWFILMFLCAAAVLYWKVTVTIIAIYLIVKFVQRAYAGYVTRRAAEQARITGLINRATKQHKQIQRGKLSGVYRAYPPPEECKGLGVWIAE